MVNRRQYRGKPALLISVSALALHLTAFAAPAPAALTGANYLYSLSDFTGPATYTGGSLFVDKQRNEAYVLYQNIVTVYNENGLEVFRFSDITKLGLIRGLVVREDGSILLLTSEDASDGVSFLLRCNFMGEAKEKIPVTGMPQGFEAFQPDRLAYAAGRIVLADTRRLLAVVVDDKGRVERSHDLFTLLELEAKDKDNVQMEGFSVDQNGNMLFTVPVLFSAYIVTPNGKMTSFGSPGSIPGKFGVVAGIIADRHGNFLVADKLKNVVSVFDRNFNFLFEFGYRGTTPGNLVVPQSLAIDGNDRLYVTQAASRGVSVFRLQYN